MNINEKLELITKKVTLNHAQACISFSSSSNHALVRSLNGVMQAEWSWNACKHVIEKRSGQFFL